MLKDAVARLREIALTLPDDDPDKLEMLNTEGDYSSIIEWALRKYREAEEFSDACYALSKSYAARRDMFTHRAETMRQTISWIMREAGERKYKGVSGTISFGEKKPSAVVVDESKIPDEFFKIERKLDKKKLNDAVAGGQAIDGASLSNGGEFITIRSK